MHGTTETAIERDIMPTDGKPEVAQAELAEYDIVQGKVSKKGIVLRPQPTNDPNEPLVGRPKTPSTPMRLDLTKSRTGRK